MIDLIVTAGTLITVDGSRRVIDDGAIAIDDGRIVAVGTVAEVTSAHDARKTIDAPQGVAMPGLVDAHGHAGHSLVRTMADDLDLWMAACAALYLHGATPEFWHVEARLAAVEKLMAGTTTSLSMLGGAGDTIRVDHPSHANAHLSGYVDVGLRSVVAVGPGAPPFPKVTTAHPGGVPTEVASTFDEQMAVVAGLVDEWATHPTAGIALTYPTLSVADIHGALHHDELAAGAARIRELSDRADVLIVQDGHRADTVEGSSRLGLLGPRSVLSHAIDLSERHIQLIAAAGAAVAHNPSAIYSQFGRCPVPELMEAGVTVGLGSDATAPDRSADMFRHMFQLTRHHRADRKDPSMFPPGTAVELATIGAARVLGMADSIGSIEVGKAADVILLDVDKPHLAPFTHPVHQIVYFATGADVDTVIVGGQVLMRNRVVSSVDVPRVLDDARTQQRLAFERVGIDHPADREGLWGSVRYLAGPTISL